MKLPMKPLLAVILVSAMSLASGAHAGTDLQRLADQLDRLDKMDFVEAIDKADTCVIDRNYSCVEEQLTLAARRANTPSDKAILKRVRADLLAEQELASAEATLLAERERKIEQEQERLQAAQERAQQQAYQDSDSGASTAENIALFGALLNQSLANQYAEHQAANARVAQAQQQQAELAAVLATKQQQFAEDRAALEQRQAQLHAEARAQTEHRKQQRLEEQHARQQADTLRQEQAAKGDTRQQPAAILRSTLSPVKTVEPTRQEIREDIIESNPYEKFPNGIMGWGSVIAPWMSSGAGSGETRAQACTTAKARQTAKLAEEEGRGFVTVTNRTDCFCGTSHNHYSWTCVTYYQAADTGKKRPVIAR